MEPELQPEAVQQVERLQGVAGFSTPQKIANCAKAACHIDTGGSFGSGSLVDASCVGFPATCVLTNEHVLGTEAAARGATVRFNYESADPSRWIETRLDPSLGFFAHKDDHVDFCLVAVAPVDASALTSTLSKAHVSKFPAALAMHDDANAIAGMPITIWQVRERGSAPSCSALLLLPLPLCSSLRRNAALPRRCQDRLRTNARTPQTKTQKSEPNVVTQHPEGGYKQHSSWVLSSVSDKGLTYQNDTLPVRQSRSSAGAPAFLCTTASCAECIRLPCLPDCRVPSAYTCLRAHLAAQFSTTPVRQKRITPE